REPPVVGRRAGAQTTGRKRNAFFLQHSNSTITSCTRDGGEDISRALASARQASSERRLVVFLAALSAETLRLAPCRGGRSHRGGAADRGFDVRLHSSATSRADESYCRWLNTGSRADAISTRTSALASSGSQPRRSIPRSRPRCGERR